MRGGPILQPSARRKGWFRVAAVLVAVCSTGPAGAQPTPTPPAGPASPAATNAVAVSPSTAAPEGSILQTGCSTCGGGLLGGTLGPPVGGCSSCGSGRCDNGCYPGRPPYCRDGCNDTFCGRVIGGIYDCICCPDPCYDPPHWLAVADSAFFTDAARPITQQRLRWDSAFDIKNPDRAEYILARENTKGIQQIASCRGNGGPGKGIPCALHSIDLEELSLYTEGATGRVGVFASIPYREVEVNLSPFENPNNCPCKSQSGFADMTAGTKTLLLDCELMQMSLQLTTFIPIGQASKGFGTAHVSLEPALLFALKLTPTTYLQSEVAYWIPIGGDQVYEANVFHTHFSLNHILWCVDRKFQLIGTAELNEWTVFGGGYTTDYGDAAAKLYYGQSGSTSIVSIGPGIRAVICEKIDVGVGTAFALTGQRWAEETIRAELRWRF